MRPLPSAGVALYRREGWREGERKRAGGRWEGERGKAKAPTFSVFLSSPARLLFSIIDIVIWDTQQEPLRRRELCAQRNQKLF